MGPEQAGKTAGVEKIDRVERGKLLGVIILIIGIYLVLDELSEYTAFWWLRELFFPAIFILGGAWLLHKNRE
ncbi:hypothetical protein MSMTP_0290 [Methanosarcina sp. MTP4]|uniref:hypothetical protein n=1 Tax=Methanosarcina sp. MTP4 TaxID=1434100 RepID=UPI0006158D18|nr:hypothetical protein [Methanosarcina sp. MTP4]AKB23759.1 hypothetical protein MSMTP_0290 [Methanosarcina sp. MTP4]